MRPLNQGTGLPSRALVGVLLGLASLSGCGPSPVERTESGGGEAPTPKRGGRLVVSVRSEPQTLNPILVTDIPSRTVIRRTTADLIHINRQSQQTEPALAESWTVSEDGRIYTLGLRTGVKFSDGEPFDADDVLFSYRVLQDEAVGSPHRGLLAIDNQPIEVRKLDSHTVQFVLAQPLAAGDRIFDSVPILPKHLLETRYDEDALAGAWTLDTDPEEMAGLGPFRFKEYVPAERLVLERNPHYWRVDEQGVQQPYLDEIVYLFVAPDAQVIRFKSGEIDLIDGLSSESYAALERTATRDGYQLEDLGAGLRFDFLFFNLNDLPADLPEVAAKQVWFRDKAFRQAVSAAVDRQALARLVYRDRATPIWTHVSPGNGRWFHPGIPRPARSLERARELLTSAGFSWRDEKLVDSQGRPVSFTLVTNSTNSERVQTMTVVQQDLGEIGIDVQVVPLEFQALLDRVLGNHDYEACILGLGGGDVGPNPLIGVLSSNGASHLWRPNQSAPETEWEAEIDRLMKDQKTELDFDTRKQLYDRAQELMADQLPMVPLVSPNILVGAKAGLGNFRPAILDHHTLWNAHELFWE